MAAARFGAAARLLRDDCEASFAFRAARLHRIRGLRIAHQPGSRADFAQALQLLGAGPSVRRLMLGRTSRLATSVHLSNSRDNWEEVFGQVECIEEGRVAGAEDALYRWKYFCTDGPVTCHGHLFERQPGVPWVVVMRIARQ